MPTQVLTPNPITDEFLQGIPLGICYCQADGDGYHSLYINDRLSDLLNLSGDQLADRLQNDLKSLIEPEDADRVQLMLYKGGITGGQYREMVRLRLPGDGGSKWIDLWLNATPRADGTSLFCLVFADINTNQEHQQKLDATYSQLLGALNNAPGGIVVFDTVSNRNPVPTFVSHSIDRMLGGTREELRRIYLPSPFAGIHPEDREQVVHAVEAALRNLSAFQISMRLRTVSGQYFWVSASATVEIIGGQRTLYMAFVDSSADREFQHIQKQILDTFARKQYEHICYIDGKTNTYRILGSNNIDDPFLPESGEDFEGSMAALLRAWVVPEDRERMIKAMRLKNLYALLEHKDDVEFYFSGYSADGKQRYWKVWISWLDPKEQLLALISTDITREYRQEEESKMTLRTALHAAELANAAKSEFLSRMSHDIRTPLNAIIGYTDMILDDPEISGVTRERLDKVASSSRFLLSLINDILDMSRIESGKMVLNEKRFSLPGLVDDTAAIISAQCEAHRLHFTCSIDGNARHHYIGDRLKLQQILLNILGNSVKFTRAGGTLTLRVEEAARYESCAALRFTMADNGRGISESFIPHLFDAFSQDTKNPDSEHKGSGLGLAICKNLATMMKGSIEVHSKLGEGSEFIVEVLLDLPQSQRDDVNEGHSPVHLNQPHRNLAGKKVLLVEDNALNMEIAKYLLTHNHLVVETAENCQAALNAFAASTPGYYSAILMDIRMPVMNGLEATEAIRALSRDDAKTVPIIALSANAFEEDVRKSTLCGMDAYVVKPIDAGQLFETLDRLIH